MPSFATLFIAATAALAAFATAAPMPGNELGGATDSLTNAGSTVTNSLGGVNQIGGSTNHKRAGEAAQYLDQIGQSVEAGTGDAGNTGSVIDPSTITPGTPTKRDELPSLPVILLKVKAELVVISDRLHRLIVADVKLEAKVLLPILEDLRACLGGAVLEIKALAGLSIDVVLALHGRVIAIVDAGHLLAAVLAVVYSIIAIVLKAVVAVELEVLNPTLALVAGVICELLVAVFACVNGIHGVLVPIIGTVIDLSRVWGFVKVLAILKV
ncbi:hypothetical protein BDZ94DRAFT_346251 [Collybia nuda]|uniref:Uncharacterized protein n=1 Tax=Collybia nuda TaxID=64659 RepID=A0A9P6CGN4_9AGAR|nr:hypothetical protein BDZ94DRAFT_346251 [Collybia nuda]